MMQPPLYKAVHSDKEPGFFEDDLPWQAQWYSETSLNEDKYERGGWYRTEAEALEAAERGKQTGDALDALMQSGITELSREEFVKALNIKSMSGKEKAMQVIYRIDAEGHAQLQRDTEGTSELLLLGAADFGYATAEFSMDIAGEGIKVLALTPDTMLADERREVERSIRENYPVLQTAKIIYL